MSFDPLDAVRAFAGEDYERAYIPAAASPGLQTACPDLTILSVLTQMSPLNVSIKAGSFIREPFVLGWLETETQPFEPSFRSFPEAMYEI